VFSIAQIYKNPRIYVLGFKNFHSTSNPYYGYKGADAKFTPLGTTTFLTAWIIPLAVTIS
jgi:hypothetical protein